MGFGFLMGAAHPRSVPIPQPATLLAMFDSANINGLHNVGISNTDPISTYKNTSSGAGSLGSAADMVQTLALRPTFEASPGGIKGRPAVKGDGTQYMSSGLVTLVPQPFTVATAFRLDDIAGTYIVNAFGDSGTEVEISTDNTGKLNMYAGSVGSSGGGIIQAAKWQLVIVKFDGASAQMEIDGVDQGTKSVGTHGLSNFQLFNDTNFPSIAKGKQTLTMIWGNGTLPTFAQIRAHIYSRIGVTPQ